MFSREPTLSPPPRACFAAWPTKIVYPDSSNGMSQNGTTKVWTITSGSDHVAFTYDRLGRKVTSTDQRGVVHTYTYHGNGTAGDAGRLCYDTVTDFGSSDADQRIRRFYYERNDVGQANGIRSYTYDGSYHVADAIAQSFDNWGMPKSQWQDHDDIDDAWIDAIKIMSTYEDGASGGEAKYVRLDYVSYLECDGTPDARDIYYNYGSTGGTSDVLSRLDNLANNGSGTTKYAEYAYLGASTIAKVAHPAVTGGLDLVYDPDADDSFDGLDRFGRVVDQRWQNSTPVVKDQFKYGYDRASNRTWRDVGPDMGTPPTGKDEFYLYDGLDRLIKANRGNLSSGTITDANAGFSQAWAAWDTDHWASRLETLGNWAVFKEDSDGGGSGDSGWELSQTRTHDEVNQVDGITGGSWIVPGYDAAGNMTSGPKPGAETTRHWYVWDAWNRLAAVWEDDGDGTKEITGEDPDDTLVAEYRYDALHRRIAKLVPNGNNWDRTDYYYTPRGQVVEERYAANQENKETPAVPRKYQYVWDIRYIHATVLRDADTDSDGDCTDEGGSERLYYTQDANFNVTALVETDGDIAERYVYDPYGKRIIYDDDWSDEISWANSKQNEILFTGYRLDNESGLYYAGVRYYDPVLGRWISWDWIVYGDGMNLYEYTRGRPVSALDRMGTEVEAPEIGVETGPRGTGPTTDVDFKYGPVKGTGTLGPEGGHVDISIPLLSFLQKEVDFLFGSAKATGAFSADITLKPLIPLEKCHSEFSPIPKTGYSLKPILVAYIVPVGFTYTTRAEFGNALKVQVIVGYIRAGLPTTITIAEMVAVSTKARGKFLLPGDELLKDVSWMVPGANLSAKCCYEVAIKGEVEAQLYSYTSLQATAVAAFALAPELEAYIVATLGPKMAELAQEMAKKPVLSPAFWK